jgi:tetratricopeptide (TPR) repeat protein
MKVHVFEHLDDLQKHRRRWEEVFELDSEANFFMSWVWIIASLSNQQTFDIPWLVLAVKPEDVEANYVAFLALSVFTENDSELGLHSQLGWAGVTDSPYPGFICIPGFEAEAAIAFGQYLRQREVWSVLKLWHVRNDSLRLQHLLNSLKGDDLEIVDVSDKVYRNELDTVDNSICPYIQLPSTWEDYVQSLGASTRKTVRKKIKQFSQQLAAGGDCSLTYANANSIDTDLEVLMDLWQQNWQSRKGAEQCSQIVKNWHFLLRSCFDQGYLFLPILWCADRPVGAIAHFIDGTKQSLLSYVSARDESFTDFPPGLILHIESIRFALSNGFKTYDFLMGNEAYKYSFNVQERYIATFHVYRQDSTHREIRLNPRSLSKAVSIAERYHREGELEEAQRRYRQILAGEPNHPTVLYNLAVIQQRQGDYAAAETLLEQLLARQPANPKVWFSLGTLYQQQGHLTAAVDTYQKALAGIPEADVAALAIHLNLGYALQQQGDLKGAITHYTTARMLNPDSAEAAVMLANAHHAQGTLSATEAQRYASCNLELGHRRQRAGDSKAAIDYYRQAVAMCPASAEAYYSLGLALEQVEGSDRDEMIACYRKAQAIAPESDEIKVSLANALFAQGQLPIEEQVAYATLNQSLGHQCQQQENWGAASQYFRQAIALAPDWSDVYCDLGWALEKSQQNLDEALACYQKAKLLAPESLRPEVGIANVLFAKASLSPDQLNIYARLNSELGHQYWQADQLDLAIEHYRQALNMQPELAEARENLRLALQEKNNVQIKVSIAR